MDELTPPTSEVVKLTKAQWFALRRMENGRDGVGRFNGRNRRALHTLYSLGLAEFDEAHDFGFRMSVKASITPAGRAALAAQPHGAGHE